MTETPLVALALAGCGMLTLLILFRALRDVLAGQTGEDLETEG